LLKKLPYQYLNSTLSETFHSVCYQIPFQFIADQVETDPLFRDDRECQELIMEAMKYHLLPERRLSMQSPRTKPRKSTVGMLYAVGGMDCAKGMYFFMDL
jgi:kelch-like protein 1/4/5